MYMAPSGSLPVAWTWPGAGTVGLTTRRPKQAFGYGAAGLTLVANRELSGLAVTPVSTVPDIAIVVDARPAWSIRVDRSVSEAGAADPLSVSNVRVDRSDDGLAFVYTDGCRFWIDRRGDTIWMTFDTTLEDACTYLVGPVLSSALRLRGDYSLHASAVRFARGAVAFAGPHGAGKSTLAAALGRAGHPVIADDVLRLTNHDGWWRAHPFGGILRLWPSGVKTVFGDQEMLESITPTWDKRALPIGASGVPGVSEALPLSAVVFLVSGDGDRLPLLQRLSPGEALARLAANSSAGHLQDRASRIREFHQVTAISTAVPCFELRRGPIPIEQVLELLRESPAIRAAVADPDTVVPANSR